MKFRDWIIVLISLCSFMTGIILLFDGHWILGIVLGFPSLFMLTVFLTELTSPTKKYSSNSSNNYYTSGYNNIWLEKRVGYTKYEMVGMYYRNLNRSDMGKFEGYAKAEKNNIHDPYSVSIYTYSGKHVGYLPKGNKSIHQLILDNNGSLPAYGYISSDKYGNDYTGEVSIKSN